MLVVAKEMRFLKVGVVSVDGTKIQANASKRRSIRYDRALELREELRAKVKELLEKSEAADRAEEPDDRTIPEKLKKARSLGEELDMAIRRLERREEDRAKEREDRRKTPAGGVLRAIEKFRPPTSTARREERAGSGKRRKARRRRRSLPPPLRSI